jgi:hypothetical protein
MGLQEELGAFRAEFIRNAPPGRAELYDLREWRRQLGAAGAGHPRHSRQPTRRARRHRGGLTASAWRRRAIIATLQTLRTAPEAA